MEAAEISQQSYQVMTSNPVISQTAWPEAAINCQVLVASQICVWNRAFINFGLHIIYSFLSVSFWCFFCSTNYHWSLETLLKYSIGSFHIKVIKQWGLDVRSSALVSGFLLFQEIVWDPGFLLTQPLSRADVFIPCHGFNLSFCFARIFESLYKYELSLKRKSWCLHFFSDEHTVRKRLVFLYDLLKKSWWCFLLLNLGDPT